MKLYRLRISPGETDGEGEDFDEWFTSLSAATIRRAELIRETPPEDYKYGSDFEIDKVEIADLPKKECPQPKGVGSVARDRCGEVHTTRIQTKDYGVTKMPTAKCHKYGDASQVLDEDVGDNCPACVFGSRCNLGDSARGVVYVEFDASFADDAGRRRGRGARWARVWRGDRARRARFGKKRRVDRAGSSDSCNGRSGLPCDAEGVRTLVRLLRVHRRQCAAGRFQRLTMKGSST